MMESNESADKTVLFEVLRYNPDKDTSPVMQQYKVPLQKGITVLDGLVWIKENLEWIVIGLVVVTTIPIVRTYMKERKAKG